MYGDRAAYGLLLYKGESDTSDARYSESAASGRLFLRHKESVPGTEDTNDFFETNSCVMGMPKTTWLHEVDTGKLGRGEYGKAAEVQACY